ncbi:MAG: hydrolase [Marinilabiliaceae bacterium]|nr:hydrolase [Marinilabiliaceae bacterium]
MESKIPTRFEAFNLLLLYNKDESLIKHALTVETVMRHFASITGENQDKWGIIGLVHDLDYELYPHEHCQHTKNILEEKNWPSEYIRAVLSHAWNIYTDVEPIQLMEKILFTIDELTGLITAACLVHPDKNIAEITTQTIIKRLKNKRFTSDINREIISKGTELLGWNLDDIIQESIIAMQKNSKNLGLNGNFVSC